MKLGCERTDNCSKIDVISDMKSYIDRNSDHWENLETVDDYRLDTAPYGFGYVNEETSEFQEIRMYLLTKAEEAIYTRLPEYGNKLLEYLKNKEFEAFASLLSANSRESILYRLPVFKAIEPETFFDLLKTIEHINLHELFRIFLKRYETVHFEEYAPLMDEIDFWKGMDKKIKTYLGINGRSIKAVLFEDFVKVMNEKIIHKIEKVKSIQEKEENV